MLTGWHYLDDSDDQPPLACSTFLDVAGAGAGMRSAERLCRPYFKGRPAPEEIAQKALTWHQQGARVVAANEPNLPMEQFGGGPEDYAVWFERVAALAPGVRLYYAGMSPGVPGWESWYHDLAPREIITKRAHGIAAHAYGNMAEVRAALEPVLALGKPVWVAELNFAAGRRVDVDQYARDELPRILDWCTAQPLIEAVTWFAYRWPTPDMLLPTPVDGAGTAVERVLREWRPPEPSPVAPTEPPVVILPAPPAKPPKEAPMMLRGVDVSNNQGWIDWGAVAGDGYSFAICKASGDEGDGDNRFIDGDFPRNWREAKRVGMVRGAYHYARPSVASAGQSVALLAEAIEAAGGLDPGDLVALDLEDPAVPVGESLLDWARDWLDQAALRFGCAPLLYTANHYMAEHDLYSASLGRYPLWLASWQTTRPPTPAGWTDIAIWQHDVTGVGAVPGVATRCDVNVFEGTVDDLRALGVPGGEPLGGVPDNEATIYGPLVAVARQLSARGKPGDLELAIAVEHIAFAIKARDAA